MSTLASEEMALRCEVVTLAEKRANEAEALTCRLGACSLAEGCVVLVCSLWLTLGT